MIPINGENEMIEMNETNKLTKYIRHLSPYNCQNDFLVSFDRCWVTISGVMWQDTDLMYKVADVMVLFLPLLN